AHVVRQAVGRELAGQRQRREQRRQHGGVPDAAIEAEADGRLDLLRVAGRRRRVEGADLLPVVARAHRASPARSMAVLAHGGGLDASPGLHRVAAARRDLEEVRAVSLVEAQRRLREPRRRVVDSGEVTPDRVGHAIDGLAVDGRQHALTPAHLFHAQITPSLSTGSPRASTASKPMRSPARVRPRTVMVEGMLTIPVSRAATSRTRAGSPSRSRRITCDTASANVADPWRIGADSPASRATTRSVWI